MRLVIRPVEPGLHRIVVDGVIVGHVYDVWDDRNPRNGAREARLYAKAGNPDVAEVTEPYLKLRDLRIELLRRLEQDGPWWS